MLWIVFFLLLMLAFAALAGEALLLYLCGRRKTPDEQNEGELLRLGFGARRQALMQSFAWLETQRRDAVWTFSDEEKRLTGTVIPRRRAKGTVILFHDLRSSCILDFPGLLPFLHDQGFRLLLTEQRAHGASRGAYSTFGIWERFDVRSWVNFAAERFGEQSPVYLLGMGLGSTSALMAAGLDLPGNVRGVVAQDGWAVPAEQLSRACEKLPILPPKASLRLLNAVTALFHGFGWKDADALSALRETEYPILLLQSGADGIVPAEDGRRLRSAAGLKTKLFTVEGAEHALCHEVDPAGVEAAIGLFLEEHLL